MLVQNGTLRVGDVVVCGQAYGRVKAMYDTLDAQPPRRPRPARASRSTSPASTSRPAPAAASTCSTTSPRPAKSPKPGPQQERTGDARRQPASATSRSKPCSIGSTAPSEVANAQHHPAGRRARLDRSHREGVLEARASGSEDQAAAEERRRHHRGRRHAGRRVGRDHHRLQRGAGRKGPRAGREDAACRSAATT